MLFFDRARQHDDLRCAARHLQPGGLAAFHLPLLALMRKAGPPNPQAAVLNKALDGGGELRLYVRERRFREDVGRLEQVIDYEEVDARGGAARRSSERLAYYMAEPEPLAAEAGLTLDRPAIPLGEVGEVWVFRKA